MFVRNWLRAYEVVKVIHAWVSIDGGGVVFRLQIGFCNAHQRLPIADDQAAWLNAYEVVTLHGLELLINALAGGAQELCELFLRELEPDPNFIAVTKRRYAVATYQMQQLLC